jgi:AcrR family transcriptional regulator
MVSDCRVATRLTRPEQVQRNRERVLEAAWEVFTEAGYAGATVDAIAARAGFSKGVVYSQFAGKADLFFALLELRIDRRAGENRALLAGLPPEEALMAFVGAAERDASHDPAWQQVLIEFRAQAAREPELNARYAALHARTVEQLADTLDGIYDRAGTPAPTPTRTVAEFLLALGNGVTLERAVSADALRPDDVVAFATRALGLGRGAP